MTDHTEKNHNEISSSEHPIKKKKKWRPEVTEMTYSKSKRIIPHAHYYRLMIPYPARLFFGK